MQNKKVKQITIGDINPFIRVVRIHTINKGFKTGLRYNPHYQFHYVLSGIGHFNIDGSTYTAEKGDLCLWAPGQVHAIAASETCALEVVGVQFDFTRNYASDLYMLASYNKHSFKESAIREIVAFTDFKGFAPYTRICNRFLAENILKSVESAYNNSEKYGEEKASANLKEFFILLAEESNQQLTQKQHAKNKIALLSYIRNHYYENISNQKLAANFGYHPVHLNRIVLEATGMSLHQYVIKLRISEALHLLQHSNLSISQIAEKVGYTNPQYFSRIFKAKTGYCPTFLRK